MITLYHRTSEDNARQIIANGFRDTEGNYMTTQKRRLINFGGPESLRHVRCTSQITSPWLFRPRI
jgi:hypothetical protein